MGFPGANPANDNSNIALTHQCFNETGTIIISMISPAGAALYGLYPDTIFARKAVYAYGLKTRGTWREGLRRDLWREEPTTKKPYCDSYFSQLVAKDELLESDSVSYA